jgi:tRNA nucleotidyltransferase (CCA-adding enzyme)
MEIYLVGGAVRDKHLGLPVKEKDWVVVGATVADMLARGFRQVGKDFPVFLHPETQEEYALARKERKVGRGYTGFDFDASPEVTLEQDLLRRDLTINAMAEHTDGTLVDPYHGKADLEKKLLRHVSQAFVEDPVRILRVGRFAARFATLGFIVADETVLLMREMVRSGEVDALVAERVWKELERALQESTPAAFFHVLIACNALPVLFPAITKQHLAMLSQAVTLSPAAEVRFAALLATMSPAAISELCDRYRVPSHYRELALLVAAQHTAYQRAATFTAAEWLTFLQAADAFRRAARFQHVLLALQAVTQISPERALAILQAASAADVKQLLASGLQGPAIGAALDKRRVDLINNFLDAHA